MINSDALLDLIIDHYGTSNYPYNGPTYILPNGYLLNLSKCSHHSDVEKWLIDNNLSSYEYIRTAGSPTLRDLGCIRCDVPKYYVMCSPDHVITYEQSNTLLVWLDYLARTTHVVEVLIGDQSKMYTLDDGTDYVVDRIRRYYSSGHLYETNKNYQMHSHGFKYARLPLGNQIDIMR